MITLQQWLELTKYRITETSEYNWNCYGENAFTFSYWDKSHQGVSTDIIYDLKNQQIYEVTAHDFMMSKSYRMINPKYKPAYDKEVKDRKLDDMAYDDVEYIDLEVEEDFLEKLTAILNYETYDTRIQVPLDLDRDKMYELMQQAHKADMSLNEYVESLLRRVVDEVNLTEPNKKKTKSKGKSK